VERRNAIRYCLETGAVFSWGSRFAGDGMTRDISALGAYIVTRVCPPLDVLTSFQISFPRFVGLTKVCFLGDVRVVRIDRHSRQPGFAVFGKLAAVTQSTDG
jgi:hypothetical protein